MELGFHEILFGGLEKITNQPTITMKALGGEEVAKEVFYGL